VKNPSIRVDNGVHWVHAAHFGGCEQPGLARVPTGIFRLVMPLLVQPTLPEPRGPISMSVVELLAERAPLRYLAKVETSLADADPAGLDLQLALYVCYELHYRGFDGVDGGWEWNPGLLYLRGRLEELFLNDITAGVGDIEPEDGALAELEKLCVEPANGDGPSYYLRDEGSWEQMREYFAHRSLYHLKEGDPHAWAIPRLTGQAKASFVAVEYDEFGAGKGSRLHQQLFADLMAAANLDTAYLGYLNHVPAEALAVVNLMSLFGLHRRLRGSAVGHFAATEVTSPPGSRRMVQALERLGAPQECRAFYAEHVEADAVHEQVVRTDVVGDLVAREPALDRDVVFGIRAFDLVENRLADHLMECWRSGRTSLRRPVN
jgi:Iron-containing redox enzyme